MKKLAFLLLVAFLSVVLLEAQQIQVRRFSKGVLAFDKFKDASITFAFLRHGKAKANIFLKDASLVYRSDTVLMKADLSNVLRVDFDTVSYQRVKDQMGRVLAEKNGHSLVAVTTIDFDYYGGDKQRGNNLPYFEMPDLNIFLEVNGDFRDDAKGYPLKDVFYFITNGTPFPATEREFKRHLREDKRLDFKELMKDRFWSWKDSESLKILLDFL